MASTRLVAIISTLHPVFSQQTAVNRLNVVQLCRQLTSPEYVVPK